MAVAENETLESVKCKKPSVKKETKLKIVIRRLPASLTKEGILKHLEPLPSHDYVYFVPADRTLHPASYARLYIKLTCHDDAVLLCDKFNGYVFVDDDGSEHAALVEFAPNQKAYAKSRKDKIVSTIESDGDYLKFLSDIESGVATKAENLSTVDACLEELQRRDRDVKTKDKQVTPLLEFLEWRRDDRIRRREEKKKLDAERRKRRDDLRKTREKEEQERRKAAASKRKEREAETKKKPESDTKKKSESDTKKKSESDTKKKSESDTKKKSESDTKKKSESDSKKKFDDVEPVKKFKDKDGTTTERTQVNEVQKSKGESRKAEDRSPVPSRSYKSKSVAKPAEPYRRFAKENRDAQSKREFTKSKNPVLNDQKTKTSKDDSSESKSTPDVELTERGTRPIASYSASRTYRRSTATDRPTEGTDTAKSKRPTQPIYQPGVARGRGRPREAAKSPE